MPERPAVACFQTLSDRADTVDRTDGLAKGNRAVRAHERLVATLGVDELGAGRDQSALDQARERNPRRLAGGHERGKRLRRQRLGPRDALFGGLRVGVLALDADKTSTEALRDR